MPMTKASNQKAKEEMKKMEVYPNPSSAAFTLKLPVITTAPSVAVVYDLRGMKKAVYSIPSGMRMIQVGEHLPKGTYIIRYNLSGKVYSEKLIKL
jgi:hypothetical protein